MELRQVGMQGFAGGGRGGQRERGVRARGRAILMKLPWTTIAKTTPRAAVWGCMQRATCTAGKIRKQARRGIGWQRDLRTSV